MAAQPSTDDSYTFVGGLNTEGGFFITPKNSWREGYNVTPATDGTIRRRKGMDFEEGYFSNTVNNNTLPEINLAAYTVETWTTVGGNGNVEYLVVQEGQYVTFYDASATTPSANKLAFSIDLAAYVCFGNDSVIGSNIISVANCYGNLIITSKDTDPILVEWVSATSDIKVSKITVKIRDFAGIRTPELPQAEYTEVEWTAKGLWPAALYNLYNQGWVDNKVDLYKAAKASKLPSNTKQWIYGKNTTDDFDIAVLDKQDFGTSPAPKGRFILDAFYQDRATALSSVPDTTVQTPDTTEGENYYGSYGT